MAKSYVTQFTEYVSEQQDSLRNKLKSKGLSPSPNATLGSLVSNLDNLQESFKVEDYDRDPNFPDIDTMFDNDPLRFINGGQYKGCAYEIVRLNASNQLILLRRKPASGAVEYPLTYVVISDGTIYQNLTAQTTHTVEDNGIFIGEDGYNYALVKYYMPEPDTTSSALLYLAPNVVELIDDYKPSPYQLTNMSSYTLSADMGVSGEKTIKYLRIVLSNVDKTFAQTIGGTYWSLSRPIRVLRVDGVFLTPEYISTANPSLDKLLLYGEIIPKTAGTTSVLLNLPANTTSAGPGQNVNINRINTLVIPYSEATTYNVIINAPVKNLIIDDTVTSCVVYSYYTSSARTNDVSKTVETLHIGNGLTEWKLASGSTDTGNGMFIHLKNVTMSQNAFSKNTTALTLDLEYATDLTRQSVTNIVNNVADRTGMTANILKLSPAVKMNMPDSEKEILTNKNWTLS